MRPVDGQKEQNPDANQWFSISSLSDFTDYYLMKLFPTIQWQFLQTHQFNFIPFSNTPIHTYVQGLQIGQVSFYESNLATPFSLILS